MSQHDRGELNRIQIKGFRSIRECDIELSNINVLIGSNGAGKSNFIAVFLLLKAVLDRKLQNFVEKAGISNLFFNGRKVTEEISVEIHYGNNYHKFVLGQTDDNKLFFTSESNDYIHGELIGGGYFNSDRSESEQEQYINLLKADPDFSVFLKQSWRVYHFHDTSASAKVKQEHNLSNNLVLMQDAGNLAAFLYRLKEHYAADYDRILAHIRLIAPFFDDFLLIPNEGNKENIVLRWRQRGNEDVMNASQLSDGTLRFICLATLLLQPHDLQPSTIIVDEPELGLHPYAITIFSEMVHQVSAHKQVILSTQSVELLDHFGPEDVVVVNHSEKEGSKFERLDKDALAAWLDDYTLGELWNKNVLGGRLSR